MGPVIALFFALAAVQAVPINNINEIDIFYPIQNDDFSLERFGRAYSNYYHWSNPIFGYNQRFFWPGFSPVNPEYRMQQHMRNYMYNKYNQYIKHNQLSVQDLFEHPVIVVTPSAQDQNSFSAFFLHNGLRSLFRYSSFSWLQQYLMSPSLKGLVFYPHNMYNIRFYEIPVSSITVPDRFRMSEFLDSVDYPESIPILFIAPEELFADMHFDNIAKVTDFKIYKNFIEVAPSSYPIPQSQLQQVFSHQHDNKIPPAQPNFIHHHSQESKFTDQQSKPIPANHVDSNAVFRANLLTNPYGDVPHDGHIYGYRAQDADRYQQPQQLFGIYGYGDNLNQNSMLAYNGMNQNHLGKVVGLHAESIGMVNNQMEINPAISTKYQTIVNTDSSRLLTNPVPVVSTERYSEIHTTSGDHQNVAALSSSVAPVHSGVEKSNVVETTITKTVTSSSIHPQLTGKVESHKSTVEKTLNAPQVETVILPAGVEQKETHYETVVYPGKSVSIQPAEVSSFGNLQGSVGLHAGAHLGGSSQTSLVTHKESSTVSKSGGSLLGGLVGGVSGGLSLSGNAGLNAAAESHLGSGILSRAAITKETHSSSEIPSGGLNLSFGVGVDAHGKSLLLPEKENPKLLDGKMAETMIENEESLGKNLDIRAATNEMRMP